MLESWWALLVSSSRIVVSQGRAVLASSARESCLRAWAFESRMQSNEVLRPSEAFITGVIYCLEIGISTLGYLKS